MKPNKIVILGKEYSIIYCGNPSDVDIFKRESLWGQIDFWTRTIRIFDDGKRGLQDIWDTLLHEILHAINEELDIGKMMKKGNVDEEAVSGLQSMALADTLFRNNLIRLGKKK